MSFSYLVSIDLPKIDGFFRFQVAAEFLFFKMVLVMN